MPNPVSGVPQALVNALIACQAPILAALNPGWLTSSVHSNRQTWKVENLGMDAIASAALSLQDGEDARWYKVFVNRNVVTCWFLTPVQNWLDKQTLRMRVVDEAVVIDAYSASMCVFPAWFPLAPLLGFLFFWVPFLDHGKNAEHLRELREAIDRAGGKLTVLDKATTGTAPKEKSQ